MNGDDVSKRARNVMEVAGEYRVEQYSVTRYQSGRIAV